MLPTIVLTAIRVIVGVFWLMQLTWKPPPTFGCPNGGFCLWLDREIQYPVVPLYAEFVRVIVRPNAIAFGWLTTVVEAAIGLSLLLGLFTRLGALIGTLWSLNLLIGLGAQPDEQPWYYISIVLFDCLYFAIGSSRQLSVDRAAGLRGWWSGRPLEEG
jgi:uncharacterized membrane protein YphA (DoxX/SURF4 family)